MNTIKEDRLRIAEAYFAVINVTTIELYGMMKEHQEEVRQLLPIISFVIDRLFAITHLAMQNLLWDADILCRSALETYIKLVFIMSGNDEEKKVRLKEYWEDLEEVNKLKQSEQAKKTLILPNLDEGLRFALSPLILSQENEEKIRSKWTKTNRQQLEQKWSFSSMIVSLSKSFRGRSIKEVISLGHTYRMSSHLMHGDETGVLIIEERSRRKEHDKEIVELAHFIRLMSDSYHFCLSIGIEVSVHLKKDPKIFLDIKKNIIEIEQLASKHQMNLYDDDIYEKYKKHKH